MCKTESLIFSYGLTRNRFLNFTRRRNWKLKIKLWDFIIQSETGNTFAPYLNKTGLFSPIIAHSLVTDLKTGIKRSTIIRK